MCMHVCTVVDIVQAESVIMFNCVNNQLSLLYIVLPHTEDIHTIGACILSVNQLTDSLRVYMLHVRHSLFSQVLVNNTMNAEEIIVFIHNKYIII